MDVKWYVIIPQTVYRGFLSGKKGWPRYALAAFLELVRHVSTIGRAPPPGRALTPCPPWVRFGRAGASKPCPPCLRLMSALASPPNLGRHVSAVRLALYPPCVRSLSFLCPLIVRSLFALLSALCRFLAGSMVWLWPGLCQLCVRSLVLRLCRFCCRP